MISKDEFKAGMRRLAGGVSLITTVHDGQWYGFTATAVNSLSAAPPTLLICVNKGVSSHDALTKSNCFSVNLLGRSSKGFAERFGSPAHRHERFSPEYWQVRETGAPVLRDALVSFECRTSLALSIHTHSILIGEIVSSEQSAGAIDPLVYVNGEYHDVGPVV